MSAAPSDEKTTLRTAALARRQALGEGVRLAAAQSIARQSFPLPIAPGAVVAGYMPIRGEIDPHPLMLAMATQGALLALPTIAADQQPLIFRAWRDGDPLKRGALGIREPLPEAAIAVPDIVLVPLAAFDRRGHRIGYGAGHYDRALAKLRLEKSIVAIGLAFATQEIECVPNEPHDVPLDFVLTESGVIAIRSS